jgi:hypothetical protein
MKCLQEKLNGIANHYALPIHMGVSKKHHVSIFFNIHFLHHHIRITKQKDVMQYPHMPTHPPALPMSCICQNPH